MNCEKCKYWKSLEMADEGECRLNPPTADLQAIAMIMSDLSQGREYDKNDDYMFVRSTMWWSFPITDASMWCGKWERRSDVDF
jgi:hypothetical protein